MADESVLVVREVAKSFGAVIALRAASMEVRAGEVHALMGANGAGKSTLVKILTGVHAPDRGSMLVRGVEQRLRSPAQARRAGIVSVYQDPALVPDLSISDNMRLARVATPKVLAWLHELGVGQLRFDAYARDLAYPVLRLIDLARALASEPIVLLLDEITAALPADLAAHVFRVVRLWRERGNSVIFISHRMAEVSELCDRATVLRDGVAVGVVEPARGSEDRIVTLMLGRSVGRSAPVAVAAAAQAETLPALEVRQLRCGAKLRGVSFRLRPGEVLGVAALEDQGQQELFDCIAGVRRPDGGEMLSGGRKLAPRHPADAIARGVVMVPADRLQALLAQRSIGENIALPAFGLLRRWGPIRRQAERGRVAAAVTRLQIDTRAEDEVRRLSGGNQQKVVIARWVANGFRTLLCFDATRGIDIGTKQQIYALVRELAQAGASVLLFTSELPEIREVCDRAVVLYGGQIVLELPAAAADEETLLRAAHGLARAA